MNFTWPIHLATTLAALCLSALPAGAGAAISEAAAAGHLDAATATAYELMERVHPENLPAEYRSATPPLPLRCATPLAVAANEARAFASPDAAGKLATVLQRPTKLPFSLVSPQGHFRLHYAVEGREAVDDIDTDSNGVPDYVDLTAAIADSVYDLEIGQLGYKVPPVDNGAGGGDEIDIYILDLGRSQNYGITYPTTTTVSGPAFFEIDNDFENAIYGQSIACPGETGTRLLDALRVTIAHEFFHVVQFGYYQGSDGRWWQEASATWMEEVAYPELDDYLQYVCAFLLTPGRSLNSGRPSSGDLHAYGASVFAHFLEQRYERDLIRRIWEEHGRRQNTRLENFDRAIRTVDDEGIELAVADLAIWSYFVGERHLPEFFAEGKKYPANFVSALNVVPKTTVQDSGRIDHMASEYFRFDSRLLPGGVTIDTELSRGRWRRQLVLVGSDSLIVEDVGEEEEIVVTGWDAYDEVLLVLSNVDLVGIGFDYSLSIEYDPELTNAPTPDRLVLGPTSPNPYHPGPAPVVIPYELDRASLVTRMSLYSAGGELVRSFELGERSPRRHTLHWDGTNQEGTIVASGIYYYVLEADGVAMKRALAVIRD
ncbi:MAG: MXAN_6640 family putative metalloprotease [Candidatus Latescibacterota bacterium]|nr:MXAN_6640 family putative metalloprotease [Candidatus Latescibacterota bacterium]